MIIVAIELGVCVDEQFVKAFPVQISKVREDRQSGSDDASYLEILSYQIMSLEF